MPLTWLIHLYAGVSPDGSMMQVGIWDTEEHSAQLNHLKEMDVIARGEMESVGVIRADRHLPRQLDHLTRLRWSADHYSGQGIHPSGPP